MKFKLQTQTGSHLVFIAIAIATVGIIGFAGYRVYQSSNSNDNSVSNTDTVDKANEITIENDSDLAGAKDALKDLDDADESLSSDASSLDTL